MGYLESNLERDNCNSCKKEKSKIFLECGNNPQDAIFEIDDGKVECDQHFVLDRVLVDTSGLCRPIVKIEFSSLIVYEAESKNCGGAPAVNGGEKEIEVDLLFELIRNCNGVKELVQSWRYLKETEIKYVEEIELEVSEPFTVTFCDRACPNCCEYILIVKGKDFEGDFDALRVVKPDLSAIAQGLCD